MARFDEPSGSRRSASGFLDLCSGLRSAPPTCTTSCRSCIATSLACAWLTNSRYRGGSRWCRPSLVPHWWPRSGQRKPRCAARSSRRWNMNSRDLITKARRSRGPRTTYFVLLILIFVCFVSFVPSRYAGVEVVSAADDARQIVAESQRRTDAKSQRYEGLLQVFDSKGKVTEKQWTFARLGAHGNS